MKNLRQIISPLIVIIGLAIMAYPSVSEYFLEKNASKAVSQYDETISALDQERIESAFKAANAYNRLLASGEEKDETVTDDRGNPVTMNSYNDLLSLAGNGQIGYISIPVLDETIPVYHGTDNSVMQTGIGHLQGSSLPVGGKSTHAVLTGHRGLPLANLFTNLDQVKKGDYFSLRILNRTLYYRVDSINVVLPEDTSKLKIESGKDYVTLVTCTPYGINSHRLLVRGVRTRYSGKENEKPPQGYAKGLIAFWKRLPMQYRHMLMGIGAIIVIVIIKKIIEKTLSRKKYNKAS